MSTMKDLGSLALAVNCFSSGNWLGCAAPRCASITSPIGDGILSKVVVPPQGQCDRSIIPCDTMTIDQEIKQVLENRI